MKLYRGVRVKNTNSLRDPVGIHWTTSLEIALEFTKGFGIILVADIPEEHFVKYGTPEWEVYQYKYDMFEPEHRESEKTIRKGSRILVQQLIIVNNNKINKQSFNKNRTV